MAVIKLNTNPTRSELRVFGLTWLAFFALVAVWSVVRSATLPVTLGLGMVAIVVPLIGWLRPLFMRAVYVGACCAAYPVGWVVSLALLGTLYFAVIMPIGILVRLRRDPLQRRFEPHAASYWIRRPARRGAAEYLRQF